LYLGRLSPPDDAERLLALDPVLQPSKLLLLGPVIERGNEDDDHDSDQDSEALDPRRMLLFLSCSKEKKVREEEARFCK
jgi:hypothetical protein